MGSVAQEDKVKHPEHYNAPQIVNNTQMRLGDENTVDIQEQPWIIIEERLTKDVVKERAKLQGCTEEELALIIC